MKVSVHPVWGRLSRWTLAWAVAATAAAWWASHVALSIAPVEGFGWAFLAGYLAAQAQDALRDLRRCEHDALEDLGWRVVSWKRKGGYALGDGRRDERLWLSPHCVGIKQQELFA